MLGMGTKRENRIEQAWEEEQREQKENQLKWYHYLLSLLTILAGVVFIAYKEIDIPVVCMFLTFVFVVAGIVSILSYCVKDVAAGYYRLDLVYGIMSLFIALIFYTKHRQDSAGCS